MVQRVTNYPIQFLACFFVVVMLFSWKESFMTLNVKILTHQFFDYKFKNQVEVEVHDLPRGTK